VRLSPTTFLYHLPFQTLPCKYCFLPCTLFYTVICTAGDVLSNACIIQYY
ncbi:hypothetical protein Zm00014a_041133, partial [Zea mays]